MASWVEDKNVPVSWTVNPFLKNQETETQEETSPKATQSRVKKRSAAGSIRESFDMDPKNSDTGQRRASSGQPSQEEKRDSESIRMISEDLVRNLNQLAMVVDAVGDNMHDNIRDNGAVERPVLGDKKEEDRKEITLNVKTPDGNEQSVHAGMQNQQPLEVQMPLEITRHDNLQENREDEREDNRRPTIRQQRPRINAETPEKVKTQQVIHHTERIRE